MLKSVLGLLSILAIINFWGCVPSIHSLYTDEDLVLVSNLANTWLSQNMTLKFDQANEKSYFLEISKIYNTFSSQTGIREYFNANIVNLNNHYFLDITPISFNANPPEKTDLLWVNLIPAHTFWKIQLSNDTLSIYILEEQWLKKMFEEKKLQLEHETLRGDEYVMYQGPFHGLVLTAKTKDLQKFLQTYADDSQAFPSTPYVFIKKIRN